MARTKKNTTEDITPPADPVPEVTPIPEAAPEVTPPEATAQAVIIPPAPATPPRPAPVLPESKINAAGFIEENPRLTREAKDILTRLHATKRLTRDQWRDLALTYGGYR
ncbi:hypothetical protein [Deinococcus sp. 23YEL01]|uniref:hypothetical protein n=1 Tax=Deinococcus sp. 23YEL01 TaxID=2745871 RepID=UPI001E2DFA52|nr:hypothetical protein [Deinococcus sp. 23YEL01]MCD0168075.1 hypothetical protein [Deinococcus sp. 23YEL01]